MKLIVGLGNPGLEYEMTRHNLGFMLVDRLFERAGGRRFRNESNAKIAEVTLAGKRILLVKPQTFMNLSGLSVAALIQELEISPQDIIVLYDELALPLGTIRIRERGSANGHNGVKSISGVLGTEEWLRIRIGVGKPALADGREIKAGGKDYLLSPMRKQELAVLDEVLDRARGAVEMVLTQGVSAAMSEFNRRPADPDGTDESKGSKEK